MKHYMMNIEHGYLVTEEEMWYDAYECGYEDITDPCSVEYGNFSLHYSYTNYTVEV